MTHAVTLAGIGRTFPARADETLLDAALRAGIPLRYGCRRGKCSTCKHYLVEGEVDDAGVSAYALLEDERADGVTLLCQSYPRSDCVIERLEDDDGGDDREIPLPRTVEASWLSARPFSESLWRVELALEAPLPFRAGQYVEVEVPGEAGTTRSYSIASPPSSTDRLELIVRRLEGGRFSGQVDTVKRGTPVSLRGPFGRMYLRDGGRPVTLVGAGSGIAPLLSILRHLVASDASRPVRLFYGARTRRDLPESPELEAVASQLTAFDALVALTRDEPGSGWTGLTGRVTNVLARRFGDDADVDVYVCGPPGLCDDVTLLMEARGVPPRQIHADAFYASDPVGSTVSNSGNRAG